MTRTPSYLSFLEGDAHINCPFIFLLLSLAQHLSSSVSWAICSTLLDYRHTIHSTFETFSVTGELGGSFFFFFSSIYFISSLLGKPPFVLDFYTLHPAYTYKYFIYCCSDNWGTKFISSCRSQTVHCFFSFSCTKIIKPLWKSKRVISGASAHCSPSLNALRNLSYQYMLPLLHILTAYLYSRTETAIACDSDYLKD